VGQVAARSEYIEAVFAAERIVSLGHSHDASQGLIFLAQENHAALILPKSGLARDLLAKAADLSSQSHHKQLVCCTLFAQKIVFLHDSADGDDSLGARDVSPIRIVLNDLAYDSSVAACDELLKPQSNGRGGQCRAGEKRSES
jgi:hypothetical protein